MPRSPYFGEDSPISDGSLQGNQRAYFGVSEVGPANSPLRVRSDTIADYCRRRNEATYYVHLLLPILKASEDVRVQTWDGGASKAGQVSAEPAAENDRKTNGLMFAPTLDGNAHVDFVTHEKGDEWASSSSNSR